MGYIYWDPNPIVFMIPIVEWPVFWYGLLFALGFLVGMPVFVGILTRFLGSSQKKLAAQITDRLLIYIIISTILGARLGHFLFYERPSQYLGNPLNFFRTWQGGLASHGAAVAIILALILFSYRIRSISPDLSWVRLLDFISIPTAFAACCIRIGNFVNQEILGTISNVPWAVVFGHPAGGGPLVSRHPVQLYEAFFYLAVFFFLWWLSFKPSFFKTEGKLIGIFLILVFGFRFFIEFIKLEQSHLLPMYFLTMGQILSVPAVIAGFCFFFWKRFPMSE